MSTSIQITICLCLSVLFFAGASNAQYPLDEFPIPVGGYITNQSGQPIEAASITFIDQTTLDEYEGTTDITGWYGNLGYSSAPDIPSNKVLGNAYPNPFGNSTSITIQSGSNEKSIGSSSGEIDIFDLRGRKVGSIPASSGTHKVKTTSGTLSSGAYFYRYAGETRKMVGSPKFITIKTISSSGSEKTSVEYGVQISAVGYEDFSGLVNLEDSQANYHDFNLQLESTQPIALELKVYNISATEQLIDGAVTLSWGAYFQTESAGPDGVYDFLIPAGVDSLGFDVAGFLGHDHANQIFSVLNPDSLAVRGWLADDEMKMSLDNLPNTVYLELVPEIRLNEPDFMESVGYVGHRFEDVRFVLYTKTAESDYTEPANEHTLGQLRDELGVYLSILDADNCFDGIQLVGYTSVESDTIPEWEFDDFFDPNDNTRWGRHDIFVHNDAGPPGNWRQDWDGDGDIDWSGSHINDSNGQGAAKEEIVGPNVLYDNNNNTSIYHIEDIDYYRDAVNASLKSRLGRDFDPN